MINSPYRLTALPPYRLTALPPPQDPIPHPHRLLRGTWIQLDLPFHARGQDNFPVQRQRVGTPHNFDRQWGPFLLSKSASKRGPEVGVGHRQVADRQKAVSR